MYMDMEIPNGDEQASVKWEAGISQMLELTDKNQGMWEGFEVRLVLIPDGDAYRVLYLNAQATFEMIKHDTLTTALPAPLIVTGRITMESWRHLIQAWARDEAFIVDQRPLCSPIIDHVTLSAANNVVTPYRPFLSPIPIPGAADPHRGWALTGSGPDVETVRNQFYSTVYQIGYTRGEEFSLHYLGQPLREIERYIVNVIFPWGAVMTADWHEDPQPVVRAKLYVRPPLNPTDFWWSVSAGPWSAALEKRAWPQSQSGLSWTHADIEYPTLADAQNLTVVVGTGELPLLRQTVRVDPLTPQRELEQLLPYLYSNRRFSFGNTIAPIDPLANTDRVGAADFETAVANVLAVLGYQVIDVGTNLQVPGIDLLAVSNGIALVISITLANDVATKLVNLVRQREWLNERLSRWQFRWIIVTGKDRGAVSPSAVADCEAHGVQLIGRNELSSLADNVPDWVRFRLETSLGGDSER